jgi:Na+-transporting methylmalonyl-CoA/oxaloacetate decarboxylase gamma subunit
MRGGMPRSRVTLVLVILMVLVLVMWLITRQVG